MLKQAVILAGGRGERLRPLTDSMPKPMAPINGVPFLDYLIKSIVNTGIDKILILLGYKGNVITDRYKHMKNLIIEFSYGDENDQTGRRLLNAYDQLDDYFLLMYGDNYWPINLGAILTNYQKLNTAVTATVYSNKNGTGEYGFENNLVVNKDGFIEKYDKKRETENANGINIGYFLVAKDSLDQNVNGNVSFESDILPEFIIRKELGAYITNTQYYYMTNMQSLKFFESYVLYEKFLPLSQKYFGG